MPIAMKVTNNKVKPKKAQSISPNKRREFIKKKRPDEDDPDTKSDEESIEVMMDENGRPVIVSSKQRNEKGKLAERVPSGGLEPGKWEKDASGKLIERISVPDLDGKFGIWFWGIVCLNIIGLSVKFYRLNSPPLGQVSKK